MSNEDRDFKRMMESWNKTLVLHELDEVFGPGNALSEHFKAHGQLESGMLIRSLIRQQYFNKKRLEKIEGKLGIVFDPKEVG